LREARAGRFLVGVAMRATSIAHNPGRLRGIRRFVTRCVARITNALEEIRRGENAVDARVRHDLSSPFCAPAVIRGLRAPVGSPRARADVERASPRGASWPARGTVGAMTV
jgi:hypothetical protein